MRLVPSFLGIEIARNRLCSQLLAFDLSWSSSSDYIEPNKTPGRIRARYLAGRSVTPGQAAIALRRVLYLSEITGGREIPRV